MDISQIEIVDFETKDYHESAKILFKITGKKELKVSYSKNPKRRMKHKGEAEGIWIAKKYKIPFIFMERRLTTRLKYLNITYSDILKFAIDMLKKSSISPNAFISYLKEKKHYFN